MRKIIIFFVLTSIGYVARSQTAEDTVKMAVNKLFETMKTGDTAMFKTCFADSAILQTISRNKEGKIMIMNEAVAEFADFISKQPKGAVDERISFDIIRIDGPLAIVWTPYKFYFAGVFSHCGVDSFQLVKINGEWKIQYLIDTRRKKPCE